MKIQHAAFRGELPILDPRLLPENNAQTARNLDLDRGTLRPHNDTLIDSALPDTINPANLYRYDVGNDAAASGSLGVLNMTLTWCAPDCQ